MFVIVEINEYMLPSVWPYGYASYEQAEAELRNYLSERNIVITGEATPDQAIPEWRNGWIRKFSTGAPDETPNSFLISVVALG